MLTWVTGIASRLLARGGFASPHFLRGFTFVFLTFSFNTNGAMANLSYGQYGWSQLELPAGSLLYSKIQID